MLEKASDLPAEQYPPFKQAPAFNLKVYNEHISIGKKAYLKYRSKLIQLKICGKTWPILMVPELAKKDSISKYFQMLLKSWVPHFLAFLCRNK